MKRTVRWICILLILQMILASCGVPGTPEQPTTVESPSGITQDTPKQPAEGTEGVTENTSPEAAKPTEPTETTVPETTLPNPENPAPTEPQETEPPAARPTEPPATKPVVTEPPVTKPTVTEPPVTEPPTTQAPTEAPKPQIDIKAIEEATERYAESIGYIHDPSLKDGVCGYFPPEYWPLTSTEQGISVAKGLLIATTHQLNSHETLEYGDVLVDSIYGIVRMDCVVVFDESNELGDWYTIYILYG